MQVGAYQLEEEVGSGSMGSVWRATDSRSGAQVAVKFARRADQERSRAALGREIEAVAALHHPGIIPIHNLGEVTAQEAAASDGSLRERVPWFAMDFAPDGSLEGHAFESWNTLRDVVLQILDALAHAHARNVIHRDMKPGNILVTRDASRGPRVTLTDFGIAHVRWDRGDDPVEAAKRMSTNERVASAGTPLYMSPEQYRGDWRAFGPGTDIYALGCMVYAWVTGEAPFRGESILKLANRHCNEPLPVLESTRFAVPIALDEWLARACAKAPGERFCSAADAAHALLALGEAESGASPRLETASEPTAGDVWACTTLPLAAFQKELAADVRKEATAELAAPRDAPPYASPSLPSAWARPQPVGVASSMGLGLFGTRAIPYVDRTSLRDSLWEKLRDVEEGTTRGILLRGAAGTGKSRTVRWLARRANETAGIPLFAAFHGPGPNPRALSNMFRDFVVGQGLGRDELEPRLRAKLPRLRDETCDALLDYLTDAPKRLAMPVGLRYRLFSDVLEAASDGRPVLVWLDDLPWGTEALGLAEYLLEGSGSAPLLVVMTARESALEQAPQMAQRIDRLEEVATIDRYDLEPLGIDDQRELVRRMLRLSAELSTAVVERTAGHPLWAVQLLGDLVERGDLEEGEEGVELRSSASPLPPTIHALWERRLRGLVERFPPRRDILQMLMIAAALGDRVDYEEWRTVLERTGLGSPLGLVDVMVRTRLARRLEEDWQFTHGLFREAIAASGRENGRWIAANAACASWLRDRDAEERLDHFSRARLAEFFVASEQLVEGFAAFFEASFQALRAEEMPICVRLVEKAEEVAGRLGYSEDDERRGLLTIRRYLAERYAVPLERSIEQSRELVVEAARRGWPTVEAEARMLIGTRLSGMGRFDEALEHQRAAKTLLEEVGNTSRALHATGQMAYTLWFSNEHEAALALQHEVAQKRQARGDLIDMASDMDKLGFMYIDRDPKKALYYYRRGSELAEKLGRRELQAHIADGMGRVSEKLGEIDDAVGHFRKAARLFDRLGSPAAGMARFHEANIILMHHNDPSAALPTLDEVIPLFEDFGVRMYVASAAAAKAVAHVRLEEFEEAREALAKMESFWSRAPDPVKSSLHAAYLRALSDCGDRPVREAAESFIDRHGFVEK